MRDTFQMGISHHFLPRIASFQSISHSFLGVSLIPFLCPLRKSLPNTSSILVAVYLLFIYYVTYLYGI